jgi:hypothetical protein
VIAVCTVNAHARTTSRSVGPFIEQPNCVTVHQDRILLCSALKINAANDAFGCLIFRSSRLGAGAIGAEAADERTIPEDGMMRGRCIPGRKRQQQK